MTPTDKAKRSDALYYETVSVNRRVLCDMVANRESDLEDAQAENARLRESVKRLMTQRDERLARAESENAKLRELVRWMYDRMDESCAVQYPYAPAPISYDRLMQAHARACDLGVEVDE